MKGSKKLGKKIKARRLELGLTRRALAERVGVSDMSVYWWETGRNGVADVGALARGLRVAQKELAA
jgi:transcriptional regulator with XRE-family HTH domain